MAISEKLKSARDAVDKYRSSHSALYIGRVAGSVSPDHNPIFIELITALNKLGYQSVGEVLTDNDNQNAQELGYKDFVDLESNGTSGHRLAFKDRWR